MTGARGTVPISLLLCLAPLGCREAPRAPPPAREAAPLATPTQVATRVHAPAPRVGTLDALLARAESLYFRGEYDSARGFWTDGLDRARAARDSLHEGRIPTREEGSRFLTSAAEYRAGEEFKSGAGMGLPDEEPATAIRALDGTTGTRRWEHVLAGPLGPGRGWSVGGVLSTAGDVVFAGGGTLLVALDARSGATLWEFNAGGRVLAAPVAYAVGGRQQISIAAGGSVLTFGLTPPRLR